MIIYIIALIYRNSKVSSTELSKCFDHLSHDRFTRFFNLSCCWPTLLSQMFGKRVIGQGGPLQKVLIVKDGKRYLATSDLELNITSRPAGPPPASTQ